MSPRIAIVILNWNGRKFLEKFLPLVIEHSKNIAEVIIADNASSDNSVAYLKSEFPGIRIIQNNENGGFSKGYNDALAQVDADYFVLLNSDIEVTPNWIEPVIKLMESDSKIAACQPKLISYYEREKFEYAGAAGGFIDKYGYPFCRGRLFQSIEKDTGQYDDAAEVFWATGACMFVRADVYVSWVDWMNASLPIWKKLIFAGVLKTKGIKSCFALALLSIMWEEEPFPKNLQKRLT